MLRDDPGVLAVLEIKAEVEADDVVGEDEVRTDIEDAEDWIEGVNL